MNQFERTELLLGEEGMARLARARVAVFGVGGVGAYAAEGLARSGIGALELIDSDRVNLSNLNRQLIALHSTLGQYKADVLAARLRDINPALQVTPRKLFYLPETADQVDLSAFDYIVDAIDTVTAKLELAVRATRLGVPIISAMGTGNKLDPTRLTVTDIYSTSVCPLARIMRRELKRRGVPALKVVYSTEPPIRASAPAEPAPGVPRRDTPGSTAFVPPTAGMIIASEIVRAIALG